MRHSNVVCVTCAVAMLSGILSAQPVRIPNNTPGFTAYAVDQGAIDPSTPLMVNVWLKLHNQQQLDRLVDQQRQRNSPSYHQWITQDQFNAGYGPTAQEVNAVSRFLSAKGLTVVSVAENNLYVKAAGTAADIQKAFNVQIHSYQKNGVDYHSNISDPSVNDPAGGLIAAITGLDDFGFEPKVAHAAGAEGLSGTAFRPLAVSPRGVFFEGQCFRPVETDTFTSATDTAIYTGNRFGADIGNTMPGHLPPCGHSPDELQTAYNLKPLYGAGLNGSGQTIVITDAFGSPTIAQDAQVFSQIYGLPPVNLNIAKAPGLTLNPKGAGLWDIETTIDVEWAHAMAPGANLVLVLATDRASLDEAINYAVVHHLGNTISNSWSTLEGLGNPAQFDRVNRILEMAAAQGIDVNFASGDSGDESVVVGFKTVNFPASSPFATGVGGTMVALNPDNTIAFQAGWGNNLTRIAESAALGNAPVVPPLHVGFQGGAGGGPSLIFPRPSFQSGLNVPGNTRLVPDIAMLADSFTGAEIIQTVNGQLSVAVFGGTSLATPMFSGIMAIAAQSAGHGLGQAAALVYNLPAGAVNDIVPVSSPGNVTGVVDGTPLSADNLAEPLDGTTTFYSAIYNSPFTTRWFVLTFGTDTSLMTSVGWDNVTGVGAPDAFNFVNAVGH